MRRFAIGVLSLALATSALGVGTAVASPPPTTSTVILNSQGSTAANLSTGSSALVRTNAPVTVAGTSDEVISQVIDPARAPLASRDAIDGSGNTIQVPDVTAPEGYTVEYYDGTAWSSSTPSLDSSTNTYPSVQGVRATGSIKVTGYSNGLEQISRTATSTAEAGSVFQGTSGGDGWDVFFGSGPAAGRVFNIFHHSGGDFRMDCHLRDGTPCWSALFTATQTDPASTYYTSARSTGFYVAATDSVYSFVANGVGDFGMICVKDVSTSHPADCTTPFIALATGVNASDVWSGNGPTDAVAVGTKVYARGSGSGGDLLCFDLTTQAACANEPFSIGEPTGNNGFPDNRLIAIGTSVYFTTGDFVGCFDTVTNALCAGFNSGASISLPGTSTGPLFYSTDAQGVPTQLCAYTASTCWGLDGSAGTWPSGLATGVGSSAVDGWGIDANVGTRFFYLNGDNANCFDFATGADCANYTPPTLGGYAYTIRQDPANDWCLWSNSDDGAIVTFSPQSGASPCVPPRPAVIVPYAQAVPRMACTDSGRVVSWGSLTITPPGTEPVTQARVSVLDSGGFGISGWTDLTPNAQGLIDLHTLTIAQTGLRPTYEVYYQDASDPTGTTGTFTYSAVAPQLCATVKTAADTCPTRVGVGTSDFPLAETSLVGSSTVVVTTNAGNPVTSQSSATATRQLAAHECLTGIVGNVVSQGNSAVPVEGITVRLFDAQGHQIASAVTDSNGAYQFENVYPNTYVTEANGVSTAQTAITYVSNGSTGMPDIVLVNNDPTIATVNTRQVEHTSVQVLVHEGLPVSHISVLGHCTTSGLNVSFTTPGSCRITITQDSVVKQIINVTVIPALHLSRPPAKVKPEHGWNVVAIQSLPEAVVTATGPCAVTGTYVYFAYAGTCRITVKQGETTVATYSVIVDKEAPKSGGAVGMGHASVYFTPDSPVLIPASVKVLKSLLPSLLKAHTVLVVGFTTASNAGPGGQSSANLSKARAKAVADFLGTRGVEVTLQAGLSRLGNTGLGVQSNRRVDLSWR